MVFVSELDELQNITPVPASSHCSSVQERLVTYGSEALDTAEHLGLILGSQKQADALLKHFGRSLSWLSPRLMSSYRSFRALKLYG